MKQFDVHNSKRDLKNINAGLGLAQPTNFHERIVFFITILLFLLGILGNPVESKAQVHWSDDFFTAGFDVNNGYIWMKVHYKDGGNAYIDNGDGGSGASMISYSTDGGAGFTKLMGLGDCSSTLNITGIAQGAPGGNINFDYTNGIIYWYVSNTNMKVSAVKIHVNKWNRKGSGGPSDDHNQNTTRNFTITSMSSIFTGKPEFITVDRQAKARLGFTKTLNEMDKVSKIQLYDNKGNKYNARDIATSGNDIVDVSSVTSAYYYQQSAYSGRVTSNSENILVPAFALPKTASASYDTSAHAVTFKWTVDAVAGNNLVKDKFIVQIADNDQFINAKEIRVDYDQTKTSYSINTTDYKLTPTQNMYFRVGRGDASVSATDWDIWATAKTANITVPFISIDPDKIKLDLDTSNNSAVLTWNAAPAAWVKGAAFVIFRINNTAGTQTEIRLSQADYGSGKYVDKQISICNEYTYSLQVIPAENTGFTAFAPVQARNSILPAEIGTIFNLTASKGYFPDRTELKWSSKGAFDNFIVKRAEEGSEQYVQIATVPWSSTSDYQTDDAKGTPGVYYKYVVIGMVNCNKKPFYSKDTLRTIGFRSPTGNIYGRVTYENGQAVEDVSVRLHSKDATKSGKSVYLNGDAESYLKLDSLHTSFTNSAFTVETWIRPDDAQPKSQVIFSRGGQYELGFDANGQLYFTYNAHTVTGNYTQQNASFVHVAGIHNSDSLSLMVNDSLIAQLAGQFTAPATVDKAVYIGSNTTGNNFKGYIDEMRVWNIALNKSLISRDYTRMLAGNENGLVAYWRFDEDVKNEFYDASHRNDEYNRNDGKMNPNYVLRTDTIPSPGQLSLKGYTDSTGNYMISGIPFTGNGTTYSIVPLLGTHQFDPASVNRLMSASSTEFTVDFKDKSSFPVSGSVYYSGGTVPAGKVQFKIDGQYAQQANGDIIESDAAGNFTIYVPVGTHEVKAVKNNHVFENDGKITDYQLRNFNYQGPKSGIRLYDKTTVRFIGRVAGGAVEEAYPIGHSLSTNNLGKELSITLALPSENKYDLYSGNSTQTDSTVVIKHLLPSNLSDPAKTHESKVVYQKNKIVIYPDPVTGEFESDIIPESFIVKQVNATGWGDLLDGKPVSIDFTNKFFIQNSVNNYTDSVNTKGGWVYKNYSDTVQYNDSYKFIKRITPSVTITQQGNGGKDLAYFGDKMFESLSMTGKVDSVPLINSTASGRAMYLFGNPVFKQNVLYQFKVKAFEEYPFFESVKPDGTPVIKKENGKDVVSNVPTQDGYVSILNTLRNGATEADTLSLDAAGIGIYSFTAGEPDLAAKGLKDFSASVKFGGATVVNWKWNGTDPQMRAYVMGGKMTGTDFVTAGPDKLLMVLRDPPGSRSNSYVEKGSTISSSSTYTGSFDQEGDLSLTQKLGAKVITFAGVGAGVITANIVESGNTYGLHHEEHYVRTNKKSSTTTLTSRFQTSDDPSFVGPPGDVFVGYSTNITYGISNNITIVKRAEFKATDLLIYENDPASDYVVVERGGINIGEQFGTLFAYPQQHVEKILIPNLLNIRNSVLLPSATLPADAQSIADREKKQVYVSKLAPDDPNFGKSNTDVKAFGGDDAINHFYDGKSYKIYFPATSLYRTDTVMVLNQYIANWEARMADNESAKLNSELQQNYSFHAGNPITYSEQKTINKTTNNSFNIILAVNAEVSTDVDLMGNGMEFKLKESVGTNEGGSFENSKDSLVEMGFTLASDGTDDYFSVDVNKAKDGSFVFRTKGGQSACPYEGATYTQYYQPGTVLDQPTQRIEVPKINVEKAVVNDVPSSRKASYTLYLRNESEAKLPATFVLGYSDTDSIKGATIAVDGTPIGGGGRMVVVQYGETVTKVLTLTKGPDAMDYNNIPILLHSSCQYDPTSYQETIGDTVLISAHFIPSCSDIHLKSPVDKWVLNSESPVDANGKRYVPITIDQFDVTNSLFDHIELQYKPSSSSTWITSMKFYADSTRMKDAQGGKQLITNAQGINYNLVMDDAFFNDQNYDIQAVSYCLLSPGNYVTTQSNMVSGIKDIYYPRLFGSPQPANGVLGINDNILLKFNEPIAAGLLTYSDFQVTGIRNGAQGDHNVSVRLDGQGDYLASEFDKNLTAKNVTAEMWVLPDKIANGTVLSQGDVNKSMELSFTNDNHLEVIMGSKVIKSNKPLDYKQGEWAHVALVYNAAKSTVAAYYNFAEVIPGTTVDRYDGIGHFEFGRSISRQGNYFAGKIHQAQIWSDALTPTAIQLNSLTQLSGTENNLLAYYPMNEGKGNISFDKAHSSNARLTGHWSTPAGKAIALSGNGYVKLNTAATPVTSDMDYTIGLWFKGSPGQTDATLASNGKGDGTDAGEALNLFSLGFEQGLLTFSNNGYKIQANGNYLDNNWHQVAIAVNRNSGNAQFFVDGQLNKYFDARKLGGIAAPYTYLGVRAWHSQDSGSVTNFDRYFKGNIDEFRIWNTYLNQTLINKDNNVRLNGNELGLKVYYPFEKYYEFQNNKTMGFTLSDMALQADPNLTTPDAEVVEATENDDMAPIKDHGPVENLQFDYVVNNDALIINMRETKQAIDKTIVTLKVKDVRDMNGNLIRSPYTWTAYIDQNQLKWGDKELNLTKDVYAPMTFESYVVNNGGSIQHFRLNNLPSWLKASPESGTIAPLGKQKIVFTVNEGLNVGSYDEIIYMLNDNNESEPLTLNLQVKAREPDWKVNPADFKYNMSVYGKIRIANVFSNDKQDKLGAFINGKCVGVTNNTYFDDNDLWYAFLTIYSDSLKNDQLEFRIWDASTGKTYQGVPSIPVTFANDAIAGTSRNPVIFDGKEMLFQNITLNQNWNWVSFNLVSVNFNTNATLHNGTWQSGDIVKNEVLGFDQYSSTAGWVGYLKGFNNTSLFMLNTANAQTLSISGAPVDVTKTAIPLKGNRWSYISYLPQVNMKVKDALAGYAASDEDVIKSQSGFAMYDSHNGWVGNLTYLEPGKGYMFFRKASSDTSFFYPHISGSLTNSGGRFMDVIGGEKTTKLNDLQTPIAGNYSYAENMTVAAIAGNEFPLEKGDRLLAYVNGSLRSEAQSIPNASVNKETFFLNIGGDQDQPVYFMIERNGEIIAESATTISLRPNSIVGTLSAPLVIHLKKITTGTFIYPNPFRNQVTISVTLNDGAVSVAHDVEISVYNVAGQLVAKHSKKSITDKVYKTTWDGKSLSGAACPRGIYFVNIKVDGVLKIFKVIKG